VARPIRVNIEGGYYHVINRGRNRMKIFRSSGDYKDFLILLGQCFDQYQAEVVAYCLMSNHYHLLIHTPHANLPAFMRQLNGVYTQDFNRKYHCDGTLFRGRYKAIVVQEEFYLMRVIRYIHYNPVKAGLVKGLAQYAFSSHQDYVKGRSQYGWLKYQDVMEREWMEGKKGLKGYKPFMKQKDDKEIESFYRAKKIGSILGENDYKDEIAQRYIHNQRYYGGEIPEQRRVLQQGIAERIEKMVSEEYKVDMRELRRARRGVEHEGRKVAIRLMRERAGLECREIANRFGIGNARSVSEYCRRVRLKCEASRKFAERYKSLEGKFAS